MNTNAKKVKGEQTTGPIVIPPPNFEQAVHLPEFVRLPPPGQLCKYSGMSRSYLNALILPTEANNHKPPVKSYCLRQRGAKTGVRLISYDSLRNYILQHAETGMD
jgi:hypothetical protein